MRGLFLNAILLTALPDRVQFFQGFFKVGFDLIKDRRGVFIIVNTAGAIIPDKLQVANTILVDFPDFNCIPFGTVGLK